MYVPKTKWNAIREGLVEAHKDVTVGSPKDPTNFLSAVIDDKVIIS